MKRISAFSAIVLALLVSCRHETEDWNRWVQSGEFSKAAEIIELKLQNKAGLSAGEILILQKNLRDMEAVKREYTLSYDAVYKELKAKIPDLSAVDMNQWESDSSLEYYRIDGQKKFYSNCLFDLFLVNKEAARRAHIPEGMDSDVSRFPLETIASFEKGKPLSKKIHVGFSFFQDVGSLPDHSLLKAWIPYVRENKLQSNIRIVHSSVANPKLPESGHLTSMLYFEKVIDQKNASNTEWRNYFKKPSPSWIKPMKNPASIGDSTFVCQFIYEYESKGYYQKIDPNAIQPYKTSNQEYLQYTRETVGNLFTPYLKKLSKEIVGQEANDYVKARKIYEWICRNVIWTDPKPVLGDSAEYTAKYKRGDCGAKSNLFISLCRINHIPARSQGGWRVQPDGDHAQHSWTQVYFEPYGWLPVDVTAGAHLLSHKDERVRYFYFGNCTPYHLIIYDDDEELRPMKVFQPLFGGGAQLGAFEWSGGDIEPNIRIDSHIE
jgi:hypothetical protein